MQTRGIIVNNPYAPHTHLTGGKNQNVVPEQFITYLHTPISYLMSKTMVSTFYFLNSEYNIFLNDAEHGQIYFNTIK